MKSVRTAIINDDPHVYEDKHVHAIYDQIAAHFSSTRYKPWPIIVQFLSSLPVGWIGLDSGTGNGKYLPLPARKPASILTVGMDHSLNLLQIAKNARSTPDISVTREVVRGDILGNGWRANAFDYAISIATIHHLASHQRRKLAVERLLECVSSGHGRVLIYVWAIEQDELSKRSIPVDDGLDTGMDVFVPWVTSQQGALCHKDTKHHAETFHNDNKDTVASSRNHGIMYDRYYHLFGKGELRRLVQEAAADMGLVLGSPGLLDACKAGCEIVQDGWERSNYYVELRRWTT